MTKPHNHNRIYITLIVAGVLAVLGLFLGYWVYQPSPDQWEQVTISTATKGGTYNVLGAQLARVLERLPGKPIKHVKAEQSRGSLDNIHRLLSSQADVALVQGPALVEAVRGNSAARQELRILARLYTDVLQIVVRKDAGIETLTDLENKKIYIGAEGSGTRMIATQVLDAIGLSQKKYSVDNAISYTDAAVKLINGKLDAAIYTAGMPTEAVRNVLESGEGRLLSLDSSTLQQLTKGEHGMGLADAQVPASFYQNQLKRVQTAGANVFLVCRKDLPEDLAYLIVEALFDNIIDLLLAHTIVQDIKLTRAFEVPEGLTLHSGAEKFRENERDALLVATGAVRGKYYYNGKKIQSLLKERGIRARVIHTDGSLENAKLLNERPTIAIMQYDAALASRFGQPEFVYNVDLSNEVKIHAVEDIRRIAVLHQEKVHVIVRRNKLAGIVEKLNEKNPGTEPVNIANLSELAEALRELSLTDERLRVCLGAENSATQIVAQVILKHHGIDSTSIIPLFLSVSDMVNRLHSAEIDAGFFVSYVPSAAVKTILNDDNIRLLSLGSKERSAMTGTVFETSVIDPGTYGSQKEDEPAIQTITTLAVLVTTEDLPFDVNTITKAIFEGEAFLSVEGGKKAMAQDLSSLPLHPAARAYYQEAGFLPSKPPIDWLGHIWRALASLVILVGGYKGLLMLRRDRTRNRIGRRVLSIALQVNEPDSVERLRQIRDEIQGCVQRRWWQPGEIDKPRWNYLQDLIDCRVREARENLTRSLMSNIHAIKWDDSLSEALRSERHSELEKHIWACLEHGELDASQHGMLLGILDKL